MMISLQKLWRKVTYYPRNQIVTVIAPDVYAFFLFRNMSVCRAIETHLSTQEKVFLYQKACSLNSSSTIVEIGSYLGASSCFLAEGAKQTNSRVYCVDTWQNEGMTEGIRDTFGEFMNNVSTLKNITPLRGTSTTVANGFNGPIDLLFIDADHSYEAVITDLKCWVPKLKPEGWLLLHDWGWAEGVQRAVEEIVLPIQSAPPQILPNLYAVRVTPSLLP